VRSGPASQGDTGRAFLLPARRRRGDGPVKFPSPHLGDTESHAPVLEAS